MTMDKDMEEAGSRSHRLVIAACKASPVFSAPSLQASSSGWTVAFEKVRGASQGNLSPLVVALTAESEGSDSTGGSEGDYPMPDGIEALESSVPNNQSAGNVHCEQELVDANQLDPHHTRVSPELEDQTQRTPSFPSHSQPCSDWDNRVLPASVILDISAEVWGSETDTGDEGANVPIRNPPPSACRAPSRFSSTRTPGAEPGISERCTPAFGGGPQSAGQAEDDSDADTELPQPKRLLHVRESLVPLSVGSPAPSDIDSADEGTPHLHRRVYRENPTPYASLSNMWESEAGEAADRGDDTDADTDTGSSNRLVCAGRTPRPKEPVTLWETEEGAETKKPHSVAFVPRGSAAEAVHQQSKGVTQVDMKGERRAERGGCLSPLPRTPPQVVSQPRTRLNMVAPMWDSDVETDCESGHLPFKRTTLSTSNTVMVPGMLHLGSDAETETDLEGVSTTDWGTRGPFTLTAAAAQDSGQNACWRSDAETDYASAALCGPGLSIAQGQGFAATPAGTGVCERAGGGKLAWETDIETDIEHVNVRGDTTPATADPLRTPLATASWAEVGTDSETPSAAQAHRLMVQTYSVLLAGGAGSGWESDAGGEGESWLKSARAGAASIDSSSSKRASQKGLSSRPCTRLDTIPAQSVYTSGRAALGLGGDASERCRSHDSCNDALQSPGSHVPLVSPSAKSTVSPPGCTNPPLVSPGSSQAQAASWPATGIPPEQAAGAVNPSLGSSCASSVPGGKGPVALQLASWSVLHAAAAAVAGRAARSAAVVAAVAPAAPAGAGGMGQMGSKRETDGAGGLELGMQTSGERDASEVQQGTARVCDPGLSSESRRSRDSRLSVDSHGSTESRAGGLDSVSKKPALPAAALGAGARSLPSPPAALSASGFSSLRGSRDTADPEGEAEIAAALKELAQGSGRVHSSSTQQESKALALVTLAAAGAPAPAESSAVVGDGAVAASTGRRSLPSLRLPECFDPTSQVSPVTPQGREEGGLTLAIQRKPRLLLLPKCADLPQVLSPPTTLTPQEGQARRVAQMHQRMKRGVPPVDPDSATVLGIAVVQSARPSVWWQSRAQKAKAAVSDDTAQTAPSTRLGPVFGWADPDDVDSEVDDISKETEERTGGLGPLIEDRVSGGSSKGVGREEAACNDGCRGTSAVIGKNAWGAAELLGEAQEQTPRFVTTPRSNAPTFSRVLSLSAAERAQAQCTAPQVPLQEGGSKAAWGGGEAALTARQGSLAALRSKGQDSFVRIKGCGSTGGETDTQVVRPLSRHFSGDMGSLIPPAVKVGPMQGHGPRYFTFATGPSLTLLSTSARAMDDAPEVLAKSSTFHGTRASGPWESDAAEGAHNPGRLRDESSELVRSGSFQKGDPLLTLAKESGASAQWLQRLDNPIECVGEPPSIPVYSASGIQSDVASLGSLKSQVASSRPMASHDARVGDGCTVEAATGGASKLGSSTLTRSAGSGPRLIKSLTFNGRSTTGQPSTVLRQDGSRVAMHPSLHSRLSAAREQMSSSSDAKLKKDAPPVTSGHHTPGLGRSHSHHTPLSQSLQGSMDMLMPAGSETGTDRLQSGVPLLGHTSMDPESLVGSCLEEYQGLVSKGPPGLTKSTTYHGSFPPFSASNPSPSTVTSALMSAGSWHSPAEGPQVLVKSSTLHGIPGRQNSAPRVFQESPGSELSYSASPAQSDFVKATTFHGTHARQQCMAPEHGISLNKQTSLHPPMASRAVGVFSVSEHLWASPASSPRVAASPSSGLPPKQRTKEQLSRLGHALTRPFRLIPGPFRRGAGAGEDSGEEQQCPALGAACQRAYEQHGVMRTISASAASDVDRNAVHLSRDAPGSIELRGRGRVSTCAAAAPTDHCPPVPNNGDSGGSGAEDGRGSGWWGGARAHTLTHSVTITGLLSAPGLHRSKFKDTNPAHPVEESAREGRHSAQDDWAAVLAQSAHFNAAGSCAPAQRDEGGMGEDGLLVPREQGPLLGPPQGKARRKKGWRGMGRRLGVVGRAESSTGSTKGEDMSSNGYFKGEDMSSTGSTKGEDRSTTGYFKGEDMVLKPARGLSPGGLRRAVTASSASHNRVADWAGLSEESLGTKVERGDTAHRQPPGDSSWRSAAKAAAAAAGEGVRQDTATALGEFELGGGGDWGWTKHVLGGTGGVMPVVDVSRPWDSHSVMHISGGSGPGLLWERDSGGLLKSESLDATGMERRDGREDPGFRMQVPHGAYRAPLGPTQPQSDEPLIEDEAEAEGLAQSQSQPLGAWGAAGPALGSMETIEEAQEEELLPSPRPAGALLKHGRPGEEPIPWMPRMGSSTRRSRGEACYVEGQDAADLSGAVQVHGAKLDTWADPQASAYYGNAFAGKVGRKSGRRSFGAAGAGEQEGARETPPLCVVRRDCGEREIVDDGSKIVAGAGVAW